MLVASLPSTKATTYLLDAEKLGKMKDEGIILNVGRGSLIRSGEFDFLSPPRETLRPMDTAFT